MKSLHGRLGQVKHHWKNVLKYSLYFRILTGKRDHQIRLQHLQKVRILAFWLFGYLNLS